MSADKTTILRDTLAFKRVNGSMERKEFVNSIDFLFSHGIKTIGDLESQTIIRLSRLLDTSIHANMENMLGNFLRRLIKYDNLILGIDESERVMPTDKILALGLEKLLTGVWHYGVEFKTVADLLKLSKRDFLDFPGVGPIKVQKIQYILGQHNLCLRDDKVEKTYKTYGEMGEDMIQLLKKALEELEQTEFDRKSLSGFSERHFGKESSIFKLTNRINRPC